MSLQMHWAQSGLLNWVFILIVLCSVCADHAHADQANGDVFAGAVPGVFAVSATGAATYTIPLDLPPGIGGMTPALALVYNSQSGNGPLGVGWSLSGLSMITRCPATLAQDGFIDPVDLDSNDRYCLDGQRLVEVTNSGCSGGTEYRSEIDSYARICGYGAVGKDGRAESFKVWTKAGQVIDYANTVDARIEASGKLSVLVWAVNRVEDATGNYLQVSYIEDAEEGSYKPDKIVYSGNDAQGMLPYHSVEFLYEPRPDTLQRYIAGVPVTTTQRMSTVRVQAGTSIVREYRISYSQGQSTGYSRVSGVSLCDGSGDAASCTPQTDLTWTEGEPGFNAALNTGINTDGYSTLHAMDINGDGRHDLVYCTLPPITGTAYWKILLSNGAGFDPVIVTSRNCNNAAYALPIDYDTDGKVDLLVPYKNNRWYVLRSTGSGFSLIDTGISDTGHENLPQVLDLNGDGRDDVALNYNDKWYLRINNGDGFDAAINTGIASTGWEFRQRIDYDGDGLHDLLLPYANNHWYVLRSLGNALELIDTGLDDVGHDAQPQVMDVNGDGRQDLVSNGDTRIVYLNLGDGFETYVTTTGVEFPAVARQLDYNGDGRQDLLLPGSSATGITSTWHVLQSTGDDFEEVDTGISATGYDLLYGRLPFAGDFNGDGYVDIALNVDYKFHLLLHKSGMPDQLISIADQVGLQSDIHYAALTDTSVYDKGVSSYPQLSLAVPIYVVSSTEISNGVGGVNVRTYRYSDARIDMNGRGYLGFATVTDIDEQSQIETSTSYSQSFPYTHQVTSTAQSLLSTGGLYKHSTIVRSHVQPYTGVYQLHEDSVVHNEYELDETWVSSVETQHSQYDDYGNPGQIDVIASDGVAVYQTTTLNQYDNDAAQWHLGRLQRATVTRTTPAGVQTRSTGFEYDPLTGLLSAEIIEPDDPQLLLRTEYTYDGYGNRTSTRVLDSGINDYPITTATAVSAVDYSQLASVGTYTRSRENALGHIETEVMDARFGQPLSLTGPNGLTTSWEYDSFGRRTRELRADGTETLTETFWCDSSCAGVAHAVYEVVTTTTGVAPLSVYHDSHSREVRSVAVGFDGERIYQDKEYNALGQLVRESRPYSTATPQWADYAYDAWGRMWKSVAANGAIVETSYAGLETQQRRYAVDGAYDQTTTRRTNVEGALTEVVDAGGQSTRYEYTPAGELARITDPHNNLTDISYDLLGRKTGMDDPDMGQWQYRYDALGRLRWQQDAKDQQASFDYDVLGRMLKRTDADGVVSWTYDQPGSKGIGKIWKVSGLSGYAETHGYDGLGRPSQLNRKISGTVYTLSTGYDGEGRVSSLTYPSGFQLRYGYNPHGFLQTVSNAKKASEVYWTALEASPEGRITSEMMGNGVQTVRSFDPASGHLTYIGSYSGTDNLQMLSYTHDALGNLQSREDGMRNLSEAFDYDDFNRLVSADIADVGTKTWAYDALGNISAKDGFADYVYADTGARPHAVTAARGQTYGYDANGNMLTGAGRTITWSSDNMPVLITRGNASTEFRYAPDRSRYMQVMTVNSGVRNTVYIGNLYEKLSTATKTTHKHYIHAGGRVVAVREQVNNASPVLRYLHQDHLGSTDLITDSAGTVLENQSFDAYGARRVALSWETPAALLTSLYSTRGYTGHEQLDELGLIHMNGRVYDPELGRFLSADPYVQYPTDPQGLNRYSYTGNNPVSRIDPSGYGFFSSLVSSVTSFVSNVVSAFVSVVSSVYSFVSDTVKQIIDNPVVQIVGAIVAAPYVGFYVGSSLGLSTAGGYAISGFTAGYLASGGNLEAGVLGAVAGLGFYAVGDLAAVNKWGGAQTAFARGVVGGTTNVVGGGRFGEGFLSSGFTSLASPQIGLAPGDWVGRTVAAAVVGGTAAELGGGKFANGAKTASFSYLFTSVASGQGGSFGDAVRGLGRGVANVAKILAVDIQAFFVGQVGAIGTLFQDVVGVGSSLINLDIIGAAKGVFRTVFDAIIPNYGYYGGSGWGARQFGLDGTPVPLNDVDWASFVHDDRYLHMEWVSNVWKGNPAYLPAGPIGQAYKILGTPPFFVGGVLQEQGIMP